jgi:hypothetical protein
MLSSKGFATVVDLNLNGTFNMCKAAFDGYMGEHGGRIVNIVAECRNGFPRMVHTVRNLSHLYYFKPFPVAKKINIASSFFPLSQISFSNIGRCSFGYY